MVVQSPSEAAIGHDDQARNDDAPPFLAAEALRLATIKPEQSEQLSQRAVRLALASSDWSSVSLARRASGVAAMQQRRFDFAVAQLSGAVEAAEQAGSSVLRGEANMSLAGARILRGAPESALEAIGAAVRDLTGVPAARALTQRSAILWELGRVDGALEDLRQALPVLRRAGDAQWEARALSNRSLVLTNRRLFVAAEADLHRAQQLCRQHELTLAGAYVEQNLGCLCADRGDVSAALAHFEVAEARYRDLNLEVGSLFLDRANVLLSVRLVTEARASAEAAVAALTRQKRKLNLPEAQLMLSTAALLDQDLDSAARAAQDAARGFARLGRRQWLALARFAQIQARLGTLPPVNPSHLQRTSPTRVPAAKVRACAVDLEDAGWTVPALEARLLAGRLALQQGQVKAARQDLALASRARRRGPADARARGWLAEATLRETDGARSSAKSALRAGLRVLEEHRATLGATELRAHVTAHRGALARAGLRMALEDGNARSVHWWAERGRANTHLLRPVQPPDDAVLAHDLQDLRTTMTEIQEARGDQAPTAALVARQVELEHKIRDYCRRFPGAAGAQSAKPPSIGQICAALGDAAMVEFVELNEALSAVTIAGGQVRLHALGPSAPVRKAMMQIPFALHRLARPQLRSAQQSAAQAALSHAAKTLHAILIAPLARALGDRPLVLVPTGWLQSVPWSILPSCAGRPVTVAPSAALWKAAGDRLAGEDAGVVAIAGPGLSSAEDEVRLVAGLYSHASLLVGADATAEAASKALTGAGIAHIAAHGTLRSDNPLFSALQLADGPFTVFDLERLDTTPHQVILAACDTAVSHVTAGEEILGLAAALLNQDTASLVAPLIPIPDAETAPLMASYHQGVRAGHSSAGALAAAQQRHQHDSVRAYASAAGFICLGAGHTRLTGPEAPR